MPQFHTEEEAINWYESQPRIITPEFLSTIPWDEVKKHEINEKFIPVLFYMRDVERLTEVYYKELLATPSGRSHYVRRFIDKWSTEEPVHGETLNRFLEELGYPSEEKWFEKVKKDIPFSYKVSSRIASATANMFGSRFTPVHMTLGAIHEMTTLNGYRRLWENANHPVLTYILRSIAREEASHVFMYSTIARIHLEKSHFRQKLTDYIIKKFWTPVGQGSKRETDTNYVIKTLFAGEEGLKEFEKYVTNRVKEQFPGVVQGAQKVSSHIASVIGIQPGSSLIS